MLLAPIVEIFCDIDDFYKSYAQQFATKALPLTKKKRRRKTDMSESEMMTIMILFHLSHYRTFKDFYFDCIVGQFSSDFPKAVSYPRFVALMPRILILDVLVFYSPLALNPLFLKKPYQHASNA